LVLLVGQLCLLLLLRRDGTWVVRHDEASETNEKRRRGG
jgi:hypothetical protein